MKPFYLTLLYFSLLSVAWCEPALGKHSPYLYNAPKNGKQVAFARGPNSKQKTLVVQIRSDQPVPLVLKGGRPNLAHTHAHHTHAHTHAHAHVHPHHHLTHAHVHHHINAGTLRGHQRPIKLTASSGYLKNPSFQRKPLKIKLTNTKTKLQPVHKPATSYDVPFKYEIPSTQSQSYSGELQQLPLDHHIDFISDHFAPIHTIPAPNLSLQDNHLHPEETYLPPASPKPQVYHQQKNNYQVNEDNTNDQTVVDPFSGSQKLIAPDPDPSLPAAPVRPATEPFNTPSNGKPLPVDIQSNHLTVAQPLVQIVGAQTAQQIAPEIYPIQYTQPIAAVPAAAAPIPIYNPTYLVQQSNNLYTQHQQQLFKPAVAAVPVVEAGYINADLTQEVASNGQILQAAKDPHNNIHPVLDVAPHFAPLIAAPSLDEEQSIETAPFHLQNVAGPPSAITGTTEPGFVVSNYFGNAHQDSSQLLQAYVEEEEAEAQRQQYEQQVRQQQQQQQHQLELQQLQQQQFELQQLQQFHEQQQQYQQQQQQQPTHYVTPQPQHQPLIQQQQPQQANYDPVAAAFEEHQRLVKQQLGADTPLRIFVPDEEEARLQKRSDNIVKGTIEDVENTIGVEDEQPQEDELYEVSSSVEVSNEQQQQQQDDDEQHPQPTASNETQ